KILYINDKIGERGDGTPSRSDTALSGQQCYSVLSLRRIALRRYIVLTARFFILFMHFFGFSY
ncbi:MAG: hypothetical protein IKX48_01825, partial [Victivallales bacterium]|nr:hypothetical protein [Victivallales bacterium]